MKDPQKTKVPFFEKYVLEDYSGPYPKYALFWGWIQYEFFPIYAYVWIWRRGLHFWLGSDLKPEVEILYTGKTTRKKDGTYKLHWDDMFDMPPRKFAAGMHVQTDF